MRFLFLLISCILLLGAVQAQDISKKEVPSVMYNKFKINFPKAKDVAWEKIGNFYEVTFEKAKSLDAKIIFDQAGKMIQQTEEMMKGAVPKNVLLKIEQEYKGWEIDEMVKSVYNKVINYEIKIENNNKQKTLVFDENGRLISK